MLLWTSTRRRRATVATTGEWQCKTGGVRRLTVANGSNIFRMLLVSIVIIGVLAASIDIHVGLRVVSVLVTSHSQMVTFLADST